MADGRKQSVAICIPDSFAGGELGPGEMGAKLETDVVRVGKDGPAAGTVP